MHHQVASIEAVLESLCAVEKSVANPVTGIEEKIVWTTRGTPISLRVTWTMARGHAAVRIEKLGELNVLAGVCVVRAGQSFEGVDRWLAQSVHDLLAGQNAVQRRFMPAALMTAASLGYDDGIPMNAASLGYTDGIPMNAASLGYTDGIPTNAASLGYTDGVPVSAASLGYDDGIPTNAASLGYTDGIPATRYVK